MTEDQQLLILGAGPAGMAASMELAKAGQQCTLVEKASQVGGLAKTLVLEEPDGTYRTDIGPHRFYSKNQYLYDFIEDMLGEEWRSVPRHTRFYIDGQFYHYPIRLGDTLRKMGPRKSSRVMADYCAERIRAQLAPRQVKSFEDYVVKTFGRSLAEFNMLNYTQKIWGIPCSEISAEWAEQRIGGLSVMAALRKALLKTGGPKTLVDTFYYPEYGTGTIYQTIAEKIAQQGSTILTQSKPTTITWSDNQVETVTITTPTGQQSLPVSHVISSIPITELMTLMEPAAPPAVLEAARSLRFRSQAYLFLTIDKPSVTVDNWIYFPDEEIPFGRISEMRNFSEKMCPPGKTSLFIEFFCFAGDDIWTMAKDDLFSLTMDWMEKLGLLRREEVLSVHHHKQEHVYPIYDLAYQENVRTIMDWCEQFSNLYLIGRPGRFQYTNQDHSLEMGILAAQSVLDGKRYNIGEVGAEKEYFEKGYAPMKTGT